MVNVMKYLGAACLCAVGVYLLLWGFVGILLGCIALTIWLTPEASFDLQVTHGVLAGTEVVLLLEKAAVRRFPVLGELLTIC